jgi:hypothetical protein
LTIGFEWATIWGSDENTLKGDKVEHIITEGINGSGEKVWLVVSVTETGAWDHIESFDNKEEAEHWMTWVGTA